MAEGTSTQRQYWNIRFSTPHLISTGATRLLVGFVIVSCTLGLFPNNVEAIRWLSIYNLRKSSEYPAETTASPFTAQECQIARNHLGFRRRQYQFCTDPRFGYAMLPVLRAARAVGFHCPETFNDRRWNCSSVEKLPLVSPELKLGTREQAVVHAYSAAALLFEIGRYCALNKIRFCSCGSMGTAQITDGNDLNSNIMSRYPHSANPSAVQPGLRRVRRQMNSFPFKNMKEDMIYTGNNAAATAAAAAQSLSIHQTQQQTQNTFHHSGCPDNVETARHYVSQFLGFDEQRLLVMGPSPPQYSSSYGFYSNPSTTNQHYEGSNDPSVHRVARDTKTDRKAVEKRERQRPKNRKTNSPLIRLTNQHNYMAGTWMMIALQKHSCKCHGLSGSCTQKVCFRQLQRIDTPAIKAAIRQRYLTAQKVSSVLHQRLYASVFKETEFVDEYVELETLAFNEHSPDYCLPEPQRGSLGTHGRFCTLNNTGDGSCMNMCCGRGHSSITKQIFEKCKCVMQPNFKVHCQTCVREETKHVCL